MAPQKGKPLPQILNTPMWSWSLPSAPSHSPTWTYGEPPTPQFHENQPGSQTGMWKLSKIIATTVFKSLLKPDEKTETQGGYMSYPRSHSKPSPDPSKSNQLFFTAVLDQQPPSFPLAGHSERRARLFSPSLPSAGRLEVLWSLQVPRPPLASPPFSTLPPLAPPSFPGCQALQGPRASVGGWHQGGCRLQINSNQTPNHSIFSLCSGDSIFFRVLLICSERNLLRFLRARGELAGLGG